jgi:hypothetical protein
VATERSQRVNENVLHGMAALLVRQLGSILEGGALPERVQIVVRPVYTWPDGEPGVWIMVNWPN